MKDAVGGVQIWVLVMVGTVVLALGVVQFFEWRKALLLEAYLDGVCSTAVCPAHGYSRLLWHKGLKANKCVCVVPPVDGGP